MQPGWEGSEGRAATRLGEGREAVGGEGHDAASGERTEKRSLGSIATRDRVRWWGSLIRTVEGSGG